MRSGLLPSRQQVNYPTTPNVFTRLSAVAEDVFFVAPGVLKCVGKDRHSVKGTILVDAFGKNANVGREPRWFNDDGAEGVAEDVSEDNRPDRIGLRSELTPFFSLGFIFFIVIRGRRVLLPPP